MCLRTIGSKSGKVTFMDEKEINLQQNPPLESEGDDDLFPGGGYEDQKVELELDETSKVMGDSGVHVPKQVHQFYFVKLWPTDPDSVSKIRKAEKVIEEMNQDHLEISEKIKEKMSERDHSRLQNSNYYYRGFRSRMVGKGSILNDLHVALDELCFARNAPQRVSNKSCFEGELDNHNLNFLMLHGSKSMAEEKKILKELSMSEQQGYVAPFSSLDQLRYTIYGHYYTNYCQKLLTEIEQFQLQRERAAGNAAVKGKILNYVSLKKAIKDQIKLMSDGTLEHRRERMALRTKVRHIEKELEAIKKVISSLQKKLAEKYQKKAEAYQSILELKKLYDWEITHYDQYRSLMNNVHQLAEKKDIEALDELSRSEGSKFMLEWTNNKVFRENYEKRVFQSLERRQLSRDGRMRSLK